MRATPTDLCRLAEDCITISQTLGDGWSGHQDGLSVPASAAGDVTGAGALATAHGKAVQQAATAIGRLVGVLEIDSDGLMLCAFDISGADEKAAEGFENVPRPSPGPSPQPTPAPPGRTPTPPPAPTPSPSPGPSPTPPAPTPTPGS